MSRNPDDRREDGGPGAAHRDVVSYPTSAFDYTLPPELIASHPAARRDESRLLVVDRASGSISHHIFRELPDFVPAGDAVVLNETRVFPARLIGVRAGGGEAEVLLLRPHAAAEPEPEPDGRPDASEQTGSGSGSASLGSGSDPGRRTPADASMVGDPGIVADAGHAPSRRLAVPPSGGGGGDEDGRLWSALVRPGSKLRPGKRIVVAADLAVEIVAMEPDGTRIVRLETPLPLEVALERYGKVPLPPYIEREAEPEDVERYQTVYARERGSVAAPTAGLHFTPAVLRSLEERGAELARLVLHVGVGTFRPVEAEDPAEHRMHSEWYSVPADAAARLNAVRARGGKIWAVGTTVTRTLETVADQGGRVRPGSGWTDIFIRPPYRFRAVDRLLTNFHLPRSTLLMLVSALAGRDLILEAYREAVERKYRFFSYGDAMLIL